MNTYEILRNFSASWGLLAMFFLFLTFIGWTFRKGAKNAHSRAANMIFEDEADDK